MGVPWHVWLSRGLACMAALVRTLLRAGRAAAQVTGCECRSMYSHAFLSRMVLRGRTGQGARHRHTREVRLHSCRRGISSTWGLSTVRTRRAV